MRASSLVAESLWKSIESTRSGLYICNFALLTHNLSVEFLMFTCTNDFITVSEDQLSTLYFLFGKNLEKATRIVDQKGVKTISGEPSSRFIFQVMGESRRKEEYYCFAEHYCACYSFFYDIVNKGEQLFCKHQLAARLAAALGACIEIKVSDEQLALLLAKL
ncbi:zinc finger SWIM domain-containing protein 7 isoform X2 [Pistacia vera]|uniref:zinc finger SWIM domain-containing protein 7 isoform X2 n=1 Tax=Pistacia vera TaxID=55513 RepID=UPI0012633569|nr:zinc finger SWIM domain-containing protein 7 isoform X2 [Pistacia vera]